jgi:hypothetical protein
MKSKENWSPISGASRYDVSNKGNCREWIGQKTRPVVKYKILDYHWIVLVNDFDEAEAVPVSLLVLLALRGYHSGAVCFKNGNPLDDRLQNLMEVADNEPRIKYYPMRLMISENGTEFIEKMNRADIIKQIARRAESQPFGRFFRDPCGIVLGFVS